MRVVERCFEAWNRGDVDGVVDNYGPGVVYDGSGYGEGVYSGREAAREHLRDVFSSLVFSNEVRELRQHGAKVLAESRVSGRGFSSAAGVEGELGFVFTVEDGLVVRLRVFRDLSEARAAFAAGG
jgi:ketosteroid isomerase-like protein